ncbi:MAG: NAD(P)H-dependent flavin oxidoreductase [Bacteroidota bacterium]
MQETKSITICDLLEIEFPVIMAPMFLVSNEVMILEALKAGITGAIPALNYRTIDELRSTIQSIKSKTDKPFGINLIVNKSNFKYKEQLRVCCEEKVDFIITSLGSPEETILRAHEQGIKVFCDVTDVKFALKVEKLGADAIIAVNKEAGGHAGQLSYKQLIPDLLKYCSIPIISAGGVGDGKGIKKMVDLGASGVSMGSIFIASKEAPVSDEYKNACVEYGAKDIVMTTKISGTPCTVINTPYVQQIGTSQNWFERFLSRNKQIKKWFKALTFIKGMKKLEKAAFSSTYQNVWCAGPSIEHTKEILPISEIIKRLKEDFNK